MMSYLSFDSPRLLVISLYSSKLLISQSLWLFGIIQPPQWRCLKKLATNRILVSKQSDLLDSTFDQSIMFNKRRNGGAMHTFYNPMVLDTLSDPPSVNVFENITAGEDVFQLIGSANGHPTSAKSISAKARTTQCFGDVSDSTFQQILKKRYASPN